VQFVGSFLVHETQRHGPEHSGVAVVRFADVVFPAENVLHSSDLRDLLEEGSVAETDVIADDEAMRIASAMGRGADSHLAAVADYG